MNNITKWAAVTAIVLVSSISAVAIKRHSAPNAIKLFEFKFDPEHGFVASIPERQAQFMGVPMFLAITPGEGVKNAPSANDLNRASTALTALSQCLRLAEQRLVDYEKDRGIHASDIQNPHVWINAEEEDISRWTIVVESKDHHGFAWHIEFKAAEFQDIWAGS